MAYDERTKQAALRLGERLSGKPWYASVGIAGNDNGVELIVYSRRRLPKDETAVPETWDGLPVRVRTMGTVVPGSAGGRRPKARSAR